MALIQNTTELQTILNTINTLPAAQHTETKTITANGTYTPTSGKLFSRVDVNVSAAKPEQTKSVTPSESAQTVTPDSGYALSAVTVAAISTETQSITANGTYTPTSGKYFSSITVAIPAYDGSDI